MPNGGYPINLVTPIGQSGFVMHADGATLHLKRQEFPDPESTRYELVGVGELEPTQVAALLFHLLELGSDLDVDRILSIGFLDTCHYKGSGKPISYHLKRKW